MALVFTLLSALLWSAFDYARKGLASRREPAVILVWLGGVQVLVFGGFAFDADGTGPGAGYWLPALAVLVLNSIANLAFVTALRLAPLSRTVPLLALTPVATAASAYLRLDETLTGRRAIGIAVVVTGAVLLARARATSTPPADRHRERRGIALMAVVALAWGLTATFDKESIAHASIAFHATFQAGALALVFWTHLALRGRAGAVLAAATDARRLILAGLIGPAAIGTQLAAFALTEVAVVETTKRAVGLAMAMLIGRLVFGETVTRGAILAAALMAGGLPLVLF
ncbi:MAG: DMT family transporter [Planctomycetota bacterium]